MPRCLQALAPQADVEKIEIIVPYDERFGEIYRLRSEFPWIHFLEGNGHMTYAELRAYGVREARGTIVALTESHCLPDPDWCARILEAHAADHGAIGGAVEKETPDKLLNWAAYLADYGRYMNPVVEGPTSNLTDCNVSYKRAALDAIADVWADEFHEPEVHRALQSRGESLWLSSRIVVHQQRSLRLRDAVWDRYAFGRLFASTRVSAATWPKRVGYAGFSFMLPPLLLGRIAANILRKGRYVGQFVRSVPALMLLTTVWAYGECVGYLTGTPEPSLMPGVQRAGRGRHGGQEATG